MSGAVAGRSYPTSEVRGGGREDQPRVRGQGLRPGGPTPRPRPGAAAWRSYPASKSGAAAGRSYPRPRSGEPERSYTASEVRGSGPECQAPV